MKALPEIVIEVPPEVGPEPGVTEVTRGGGIEATYVKPLVSVPLRLSGFVTTTFNVPAAWAGVIAVMDELLVNVTEAELVPPKDTPAPFTKPDPVIVTVVPPAVLPVFGDTEVTVGGVPPPPVDLGRIVESFLSPPGATFK